MVGEGEGDSDTCCSLGDGRGDVGGCEVRSSFDRGYTTGDFGGDMLPSADAADGTLEQTGTGGPSWTEFRMYGCMRGLLDVGDAGSEDVRKGECPGESSGD